MTVAWTPWLAGPAPAVRDRIEFLAGVHVGVLEFEVSAGACRAPVWCRCEDGVVVLSLATSDPLHERIGEARWATLEIGDDVAPFSRLVVEGPLTVDRVEGVVVAGLRPQRWRPQTSGSGGPQRAAQRADRDQAVPDAERSEAAEVDG